MTEKYEIETAIKEYREMINVNLIFNRNLDCRLIKKRLEEEARIIEWESRQLEMF